MHLLFYVGDGLTRKMKAEFTRLLHRGGGWGGGGCRSRTRVFFLFLSHSPLPPFQDWSSMACMTGEGAISFSNERSERR